MDVEELLLETEGKMEDALSALQQKLRVIRTGRANPAMVEHIEVEAYGDRMRLNQLAQVAVPEARLIMIKPFDPSIIDDIEKGILAANIGLTPQNDGRFLRLAVPSLTEERRKRIAQDVRNIGEQIKVSLRNIRRDANKHVDEAEKNGDISEDTAYAAKEDIQETLKTYEKKVEEMVAKKVEEVRTL